MIKYHIKYKKKNPKKSEFTLDINAGFVKVQTVDVMEAVISTDVPLTMESLKALRKAFTIRKVKT